MDKVISIDPAPVKKATVFDGEKFELVGALKLPEYVRDLTQDDSVKLLCWDAPLTGPPILSRESDIHPSHYYSRKIDRFFGSKHGLATPEGISVRPYAGCSHWAVTRASLGYPWLGDYCVKGDTLPFKLADQKCDVTKGGPWLVETHPAVAMWLWLKDSPPDLNGSWKYKKSLSTVRVLWTTLCQKWPDDLSEPLCAAARDFKEAKSKINDDMLDTAVGWVLGKMLLAGEGKASILGTYDTGTFLLPEIKGLADRFNNSLKN